MLTLKGAICGTILFAFVAVGYVTLRMKMISDASPHPAGTQVGTDLSIIKLWTLTDPMFWIMLIACVTLCSFMFQALKKG